MKNKRNVTNFGYVWVGYKIWNDQMCDRYSEIRNIKIAKDELFDYFIYEFIFSNYLNTQSIWSFFHIITFYEFFKLLNYGNFIIFQMKK